MVRPRREPEDWQIEDGGGWGGTRTLDLRVMSATL
jgi:hypothetical protein